MTTPEREEWPNQYLAWIKTHDRAVTKRLSQDMAFIKTFEKGWKLRQPEIDALNDEVERRFADSEAWKKRAFKAEDRLIELNLVIDGDAAMADKGE